MTYPEGAPNRIKELRLERGMSQLHLARSAGTTQVHIGRLESGKRGLTVKWMGTLAKVLNCHPTDLLVDPFGFSEQARLMARIYDLLQTDLTGQKTKQLLKVLETTPLNNSV